MAIIETERLTLRRIGVADAAFMLELLNEPSFLRYIGDRGVRTLDDATAYILNGPVASYQRHGFGLYLTLLKQEAVPIGICGLLKRDTLPDADLGFAFVPRAWRRGYALESTAAVLAYARRELGLRRIAAITSPDNDASISLLEKLGFRREGTIRLTPDGPETTLLVHGSAVHPSPEAPT